MKKVFWTTKTGERIDIDDMSVQHLRNSLKMIVTNIEKLKLQQQRKKHEIHLQGEIAIQLQEQMIIEEFGCDEEYEFFNAGL